MKFSTLSILVVLAAVAAVGNSAVVQPNAELIENDTGLTIETTSSEADPLTSGVDPLTTSVEVDPITAARNRLVHRATFRRGAAPNTIQVHNHTWRGSTRITSVRAFEIGASQGASARITAGGVGFTHVTVQMQSRVGWGFNIQLDVYAV